MDRKEQQLIQYYLKTMTERTFDEKDVHAFLVLVRPYAKTHGVIEQLIEFVITRENVVGEVQSYLTTCIDAVRSLGTNGKKKKIPELCTFKDFRNSMNALCQQFEVEKFSNEVLNDIMLCIISLLQDVHLLHTDNRQAIGHLSFGASSKHLYLMGNVYVRKQGKKIPVTFPVLSVQNRYEQVQPQDHEDTPYLFDVFLMETIRTEKQLLITFPEEIHE